MGNSNLSAIKKRIKSVKNTIKITKAMRVVANSKMKKCKAKLYSNNEFFEKVTNAATFLKENHDIDNKYMLKNKGDKSIYIVFTSDMGLCGGYNSNIFAAVENEIKNQKEEPYIIACGEKGVDYFKRQRYETIAEYVEMSDNPSIKDAYIILNKVITDYSKDIGNVKIAYYKYISPAKKEVIVESLIPVNTVFIKDDNKESSSKTYDINFNIADNFDIEKFIEFFLQQKLLNSMINAKVSEQYFRIEATSNANKNGNEILYKLRQKYNRKRQSSITSEICEIIGGAEALK